jgi:hypothetical protein
MWFDAKFWTKGYGRHNKRISLGSEEADSILGIPNRKGFNRGNWVPTK